MNITGLDETQVKERIKNGEVNYTNIRSNRGYIHIFLSNFFDPQNVILIGSLIILYSLNRENSVTLTGGLIALNLLISLIQEIRAKIALDKLAALNVSNITVIRGGIEKTIPVNQIVKDDIIKINPGDPIAVDGKLLQSNYLEIDESFLTGEAESVSKKDNDYLLSGAFCITGTGIMSADKIGFNSHLSEISKSAKVFKNLQTPLERNISSLFHYLIIYIALLIALTIIKNLLINTSPAEYILQLVIIISSIIPQGLIFAITISLAFGAIKMTKYKTLIHKVNAVESMGQINVLCLDKTGTLTENKLSLEEIIPLNNDLEFIKEKLGLYIKNISWMNRTLIAIYSYLNTPSPTVKKIHEIPFNSERKWSATSFFNNETYILGAPEIIIKDPAILQKADEFTKKGYRVILFANTNKPLDIESNILPNDINPLALIVIEDKIRDDIKSTLALFEKHKVTIKVISGDNRETVKAIAIQSGINDDIVITNDELSKLSEEEFRKAILTTNLFARITPDIKKKIVDTLMKEGLHVAMIGDGVNDVPALKQANLAIAIDDGAQITKDIADMVLLNNAFSTLPKAFQEGRSIKQRLYAIMKIFFIKVTYLSILFTLAAFSFLPFPLTLLQATWLSFVIAGLPTTLIIFKLTKPTITTNIKKDMIFYSVLWGVIITITIIVIILINRNYLGENTTMERTLITVFTSIIGQLIFFDIHGLRIFNISSYKKKGFILVTGLILIISIIPLIYIYPKFLELSFLNIRDWIILIIAILTSYLLFITFFYKTNPFPKNNN